MGSLLPSKRRGFRVLLVGWLRHWSVRCWPGSRVLRAVVAPQLLFSHAPFALQELNRGLSRGTQTAAGWILLSQLYLDDKRPQQALTAAQNGIRCGMGEGLLGCFGCAKTTRGWWLGPPVCGSRNVFRAGPDGTLDFSLCRCTPQVVCATGNGVKHAALCLHPLKYDALLLCPSGLHIRASEGAAPTVVSEAAARFSAIQCRAARPSAQLVLLLQSKPFYRQLPPLSPPLPTVTSPPPPHPAPIPPRWVKRRNERGSEPMTQAGLMLRLHAAQALQAMGMLQEALVTYNVLFDFTSEGRRGRGACAFAW